jgi:poly(3-hydroxyalkanoate) synthetase
LEDVVRETLDGEKETFEQLLYRVMNDFKKPKISWLQFLGHFSKRGRLQGYNELEVSPTKDRV